MVYWEFCMDFASEGASNGQVVSQSQSRMPWPAMLWFLALLLVCYAPVLQRLVRQWYYDEDMGHGFFVPVLVAYIAWRERERVLAVRPQPAWWGLLIVAWGAFQLYLATVGAELFLARTAFLISLVGCITFVAGWPVVRALAFPLTLLLFMIAIPAVIYNQITFPLQLLASELAESALSLSGIPVLREGNVLEIPSQQLSVVEACSGIRSLLSLSFLALVYAYFFDRKVWMRLALLVATVPIAILANSGRVTVTGILSEIDPELAEGFFHTASGWVIFMTALAMLILVHQGINLIYRLINRRK